MALPRIALLTTGGTIAAGAASRAEVTGYKLQGLGPEALLQAVPELRDIASIEAEGFGEIISSDATPDFMLRLAKRVSTLLARDEVDGVVITHGTDTLEETAWFLHLTVRSAKPVVFTGAMRPGTALGADGPANLLRAAQVAAAPYAMGRGVLAVMNDRIYSARLVRKAHTSAPDAFRGGEIGMLAAGRPVFMASVEGRHTFTSRFDAMAIDAVPTVDLLTLYTGVPAYLLDAVMAARPAGLVLGCTGNGSLSGLMREAAQRVIDAGIVLVRSSRTLSGATCWDGNPGLMAGIHNPQKARLLLGLALQETRRLREIQNLLLEH